MLIVETIAKIRRLHFNQGLGIKTICRFFDVLVAFDTAGVDIKPTLLSVEKEAQKFGLAKRLECQRLSDGWMRGLRASQIEDAKYGSNKD